MTAMTIARRPPLTPAVLCLLSAVLLAGCSPPGTATDTPSARVPAQCVQHDGLPDRRCTPGAIRHGIGLATICAFGYSRSIRPPESFTEALKLAQIRAYHLPGPAHDYEEDHLVPLSIGGAPRDPRNLWPEPRSGPNNAEQKDRLESWAARAACARRIPLRALQHDMATDWTGLYRHLDGQHALRDYPPGS